MTYCLAIAVDRGLVLASDSRTNAGVDQVGTYSKMYDFCGDGERVFTVLTAGNLATTQAVVRRLQREIDESAAQSFATVADVAEAAEHVGALSLEEQNRHARRGDESFKPEASFIVAGQVGDTAHQIFMVYPEGNYIRASRRAPFLQIGELKYGKPILDRIIEPSIDLETAARCALVSMDSTMRSNLTVGPPIELAIYETRSLRPGYRYVLDEDDDYLRTLRSAWQERLKQAFAELPRLPARPPRVRIVDAPGD